MLGRDRTSKKTHRFKVIFYTPPLVLASKLTKEILSLLFAFVFVFQ